jgi:hypothetical protein
MNDPWCLPTVPSITTNQTPDIKYVPGTVIVGDHGQYVFTRGYHEIAGVRIYDEN